MLQRVIDPHPVAKISVWFEHRLELNAIDRSVDGHLPARRQVLARRLRQPQHSRCVDRGQRGVEANGRSLCALSHHRLSSSPFRTRHPDGDTVIECVTVDTVQNPSDHEHAMTARPGDLRIRSGLIGLTTVQNKGRRRESMRTIPTGQPLGSHVASARHNQRIWRLGAWILHPMHRLLSSASASPVVWQANRGRCRPAGCRRVVRMRPRSAAGRGGEW